MSDRPLIFTAFAGATLDNGSSIRQVAPYETSGDVAVTRIFRLSNGAKFDADGTDAGAVQYGDITAVFRVTGATHQAAVTTALTLTAKLNTRGTLTGAEYGASSAVSRTCTARCVAARQLPRAGLPMAVGRKFQIEIEMTFERFTAFS